MYIKENRNILVSIDGSENSWNALKIAVKDFLNKKDHLIICSITDSKKIYLDDKFKPQTLFLECKNYAISNVFLKVII